MGAMQEVDVGQGHWHFSIVEALVGWLACLHALAGPLSTEPHLPNRSPSTCTTDPQPPTQLNLNCPTDPQPPARLPALPPAGAGGRCRHQRASHDQHVHRRVLSPHAPRGPGAAPARHRGPPALQAAHHTGHAQGMHGQARQRGRGVHLAGRCRTATAAGTPATAEVSV